MKPSVDPIRAAAELPALTGLRGLAALLVFGFHLHHLIAPMPIFARGFLGVDVFFVLSGFLLAWLAGAVPRMDWRAFYLRRFLRILPALYAQMLILGVLVGAVGWTWLFQWPGLDSYLLQFSLMFHLGSTPLQPLVGPWWSIPVELAFYLVFPVLWSGLRRFAVIVVVAVLLLVWAYRIGLMLEAETSPWLSAWLSLLPGRLDQFLYGMLAAIALRAGMGAESGRRNRAIWLGLIVCVIPLAWPQLSQAQVHLPAGVILNSLFAAGLALLMFGICAGPSLAGRVLAHRSLLALGVVSYGIYLWHVPAMMVIRHVREPSWPAIPSQLAAFALTILLAALSWYLIERPIQRRWRPPITAGVGRVETPDSQTQRPS